jgi:catalase
MTQAPEVPTSPQQDGESSLRSRPGVLTTRQGHPVVNNQNSRTVGRGGPATLENYALLEKISHFDRERIPERVVHARGFTAHGVFEAYARSATSRRRSIPARSCSRRRASRPRSPSGSPPSSAAATPPRRRATPVGSR